MASRRTVSFSSSRRMVLVTEGRAHLRDVYYLMLSSAWWKLCAWFVALFLVVNAVFALAYLASGGIAGARPGNFGDAFFFSVQTMATIGYGGMHPSTLLANLLVTTEAMCSLFGLALTTGLLFAKFARPTARVIFSRSATLAPRDGVPSLIFRIANERANHVVEAQVRLILMRNETTPEGETLRRMHDLTLVRSQSSMFVLTWTVVHPITHESPLHGATREWFEQVDADIVVSLVGFDETLGQTIHSRHSYKAKDIVWGGRFVDILTRLPSGELQVDYTRFHEVSSGITTATVNDSGASSRI